MKDFFLELDRKFHTLVVRERILVTFSVCAVIYLIFNFASSFPILMERKELNSKQEAVDKKIKTLLIEKATLDRFIKKDPNTRISAELSELNKKLTLLDEELESLSAGLVSAEKLPQVLHKVLRSMGDIQLLSLETMPPQALAIKSDSQETASPPSLAGDELLSVSETEKEKINVYRNNVRVTMLGTYLDVFHYLRELENISWRFYWDYLDYEVVDYPFAKITVDVYTISTEEGMLGVEGS